MFRQFADTESRVIDVPDGRTLFYAAGRVYYLSDRAHAERLDTQLKWIHNLSTLGMIAAFLIAQWRRNWWLALGALPIFLCAAFAERFVVRGCTEATDPAARALVAMRNAAREVDIGPALIWPALIAIVTLAPMLLRGKNTKSSFQLLESGLVILAVAVGAVQLLRQRRARQERDMIGEPRSVENTPIVPR